MRVLVTGANGFVGKSLRAELLKRGSAVTAALRNPDALLEDVDTVPVGNIDEKTDWTDALHPQGGGRDVEVVIHLAARVHVMKETSVDPLTDYLKVNLYGTANLAYQAARAGVKRLVYVSSVKVNGECATEAQPYVETDPPDPQDPYAVSKWEAELALQRIAQETALEVVIVRPPLVYGSGVAGNFVKMMKVIEKGIPLPLASVKNRRSLLYIGNLVDALITCATHPAAAGETYLVSDGAAISTSDLLRQLAAAMNVPARLFPCPPTLISLVAKMAGKSEQAERLLGSLQVDSDKIRRELNWQPPYSVQQGLQATADWYRTTRL